MSVHPLVFSNNPRYRITRHSLFWLLWILFYTVYQTLSWKGTYPLSRVFPSSLLEVTLMTPLDMCFCYAIIYYILPRYLYKGRYIGMIIGWISLSLVFILAFHSYSLFIIPYLRHPFGMPIPLHEKNRYWIFMTLFYQINMEGCMAAAIKLGKMWFIKQRELDLVKREMQKVVPHLQEGKAQPVFLINALDKVQEVVERQPALVPGMIRQIKDLLLYAIYENNQASVSLEKELRLLEEYVKLEKSGLNGHLKTVVKITGDARGERIAPFIIFPLVENGFRQLAQLDLPDKSIDIAVGVEQGTLQMKVCWSKPIDSSTLIGGGYTSLQHIGKRLSLLYPQSHDFRVFITTEQIIINLDIDLHRAIY